MTEEGGKRVRPTKLAAAVLAAVLFAPGPAAGQEAASGACEDPAYSVLDFWVGDWRVEVDGGVRFQGGIRDPGSGRSRLDRTTLTPLDDGRVRQHIQVSVDGGGSWTTTFDAVYVPSGRPSGDPG